MPTHNKLSTKEREKVRVLYEMGGHSYQKLADMFNSSKSTIMRIIREGTPEPKPPPIQIITQKEERPPLDELSFQENPILFRIQMMQDLRLDTAAMATRGVNPAALYKLQLELHDQITALKKAAGQLDTEENLEALQMQMEQAFLALPPSAREMVQGIMGDFGNVVALGGKK